MDITTFIAQFLGYFLVLFGGAMLLKRNTVEVGIRSALKNKGTLYFMGAVEVAAGLLLILSHSSWATLTDKAVSLLSWFLLIEGVFYLMASQKMIKGVIKFIHIESIYYTISFAFVVVGAILVLGM
jgi:hypothetical protein